jgi:hypothetical protein
MSVTAPTVQPPQAGATPGNLTQSIWAAFLISQINAEGGDVPYTVNNIENIERWMVAEEPPSNWFDRNNPLNASLGTSAADGTGSYANLTAGAVYTAKMILQSNMSGIYQALASNAPTAAFSSAVVASPWASSHYGGDPNHIATIAVPAEVSAGSITDKLPADPGAVVPASPTPLAPGVSGVNVGGGVSLSWESGLTTLLGDLTSSSFWQRVGIFSLGVVFIVGGLVLFISTTKTGQKVESDAAVAAVA